MVDKHTFSLVDPGVTHLICRDESSRICGESKRESQVFPTPSEDHHPTGAAVIIQLLEAGKSYGVVISFLYLCILHGQVPEPIDIIQRGSVHPDGRFRFGIASNFVGELDIQET